MMLLTKKLYPLKEMDDLREQIDRLFEPVTRNMAETMKTGCGTIPLELVETPTMYKLRAIIPGVYPEQMDVQATGKTLTLKAEFPPAELQSDEFVHLKEFAYGKYSRTLEFVEPILTDEIKANYKDGILTLEIPKEKAQQSTSVKINVDSTS